MHTDDSYIFRYKYLPFDEGSLEVIKSGTIKFSSPSEFNDPFDCKPWYKLSSNSNSSQKEKELLKRVGDFHKQSPAKRLQSKGVYKARIDKKIKSGSFIDDLNRQYGVLCLSRNALSILMWSHYARNHEGFLVEFKIPIFGDEDDVTDLHNLLVPLPITYANNRPILDVFEHATHESLEKHLLTKSEEWKYEDEERVIDHLRGPGIHTYNRSKILCSVIAGMNMNDQKFKRLREVVSETNKACNMSIPVFKAIEIPGKYAITVPNHERLDVYNKNYLTTRS